MNECVFIYRTYHSVPRRFTILLESGCQLVKEPLAAAISPYLREVTYLIVINVDISTKMNAITKSAASHNEIQNKECKKYLK